MLSDRDAGLAAQIAKENYYSNPFWRDQLVPRENPLIVNAVEVARRSEIDFQMRFARSRRISRRAFFLGLLLLLYLRMAGLDTNVSDDYDRAIMIVLMSLSAFAVAFFAFVLAGNNSAWNPYHRALNQVSQDSWSRYQAYLERLSARDPGLYASVQLWHQQEEALRLSRVAVQQQARIIQQNSAILSASQRTADELAQARLRDQNRPK